MPVNGPTEDDEPDKYTPPSSTPYRPTGPQPVPWRELLTWIFRAFTRRFASVSVASLGRGLELTAAGALITGLAISWHFGAPPFAGASRSAESCEHHCCHTIATPTSASPEEGLPAADGTSEGGMTERERTTAARDEPHRGDEGALATADCPCAMGEVGSTAS